MKIVALVGASGSGKTVIAEAINAKYPEQVCVYHFDCIGVPSLNDMILHYGSPEAWQRAQTLTWIDTIRKKSDQDRLVLFEGQMRFSFLSEAVARFPEIELLAVLIDCRNSVRAHRLQIDRKQPELATEDMMNWAAYLRKEALDQLRPVIDTSDLSLHESVERLVETTRL